MKNFRSVRPTEVEILGLVEEEGGLGTWWWDFSTHETWWSAGLYRLLGFDPSRTEPSLSQYEQVIHPEDRLDLADPARAFASGAMTKRNFRILRPDGGLRWIQSCSRTVYDESGHPSHVIGVAFDDSNRRQLSDALEQREHLFTALKELLEVTFWRTAADGSVSDALEWWLSTGQMGETEGWNRLQVIHPDDRQSVRDAWAEALRGGRRYAASFRALIGNDAVPYVSRAVASRSDDGQLQGWVGFSMPATGLGGRPGQTGVEVLTTLPPDLVRGARGFLGWTAQDLADKAKVSFSTVRRAETPGSRTLRAESVAAIRLAFENAGVRFVRDAAGKLGMFGG